MIREIKLVQSRLRHDSTIMIVSSVLSLVEDLNKELWPNIADRPNYIIATPSIRSWPAYKPYDNQLLRRDEIPPKDISECVDWMEENHDLWLSEPWAAVSTP